VIHDAELLDRVTDSIEADRRVFLTLSKTW